MSELFDEISRMVGSRMPRRQVIRLAAAALAGSAFSALWPARVWARTVACDTSFPHGPTSGTVSAVSATQMNLDRACVEAKKNNKESAQVQCPTNCSGIVIIDQTCDFGNYGLFNGQLTLTASGNFKCGEANRVCNDNTVYCPTGKICCGGKTCCTQAACAPTGKCMGGNPSA